MTKPASAPTSADLVRSLQAASLMLGAHNTPLNHERMIDRRECLLARLTALEAVVLQAGKLVEGDADVVDVRKALYALNPNWDAPTSAREDER